MTKYIARVNSFGFRKRYWKKGDVVNISDKELELPEIKHFKKFDKGDIKKPVPIFSEVPKDLIQIQNEMINAKLVDNKITVKAEANVSADTALEKLRNEYLQKYGKEVPNNMKNNIDWITIKIEEA